MIPTPAIIRKKRDGAELSAAELRELLTGYLRGDVKDYQMAAWLMAVYFRGMSPEETRTWTDLMWKSGVTFPREERAGFWVDKHSTGGVGDKTSLILVPLVSACARRLFGEGAVKLPMVSGRGLAHSGGTLDKLEAVPGFSPAIAMDRAMQLLSENGFFMMGQTDDLAPADRLLYALRDVTGTVECVPLIVSSILSKKLSENLDGLVLDVKFGAGAFMPNREAAAHLGQALVETARAHGVAAVALLTAMDEPLGWKVGNQLEVEECEDYFEGRREPGLHEVTVALAGAMIRLASRGKLSHDQAQAEIEHELTLPAARALYRRMFEAQGGDWAKYQQCRLTLREEMSVYEGKAERSGFLASTDALKVGLLVHQLGGGRARKEDAIDPSVGVEFLKKAGEPVQEGETWAKVYYRNPSQRKLVESVWPGLTTIQDSAPAHLRWVVEVSG